MPSNMFENLKGIKKSSAVPAVEGRAKRGKSSDPKYTQTSVYLQRETIKKAQVKLIEQDFDFSDLIQELLQDWVEKN
jgi:hypothetical protein